MRNDTLKALYQSATRGLPNQAELRLSGAELLTLAQGGSLGERQQAAVRGLAESSSQSAALGIINASCEWSEQLAGELKQLRRPSLMDSIKIWWQNAGLPPVLASAGIVLMAAMGFHLTSGGMDSGLTQPQIAVAPVNTALFSGEFEPGDQLFAASLETSEAPDRLFGGNFDS